MKPISAYFATHSSIVTQVSLDTDVIIWYLRQKGEIVELINNLDQADIALLCSVVVILEVLRGMRTSEKSRTLTFLHGLRHIAVDDNVVHEAYRLFQQQPVGITMPFVDSIIAATAVIAEAPLLTFNTKHYPKNVLYPLNNL